MPLFERTPATLLATLKALLPTGAVWPREPDAALSRILGGPATTFARIYARAQALIVDAFPATTLELLPEWERTLGLPDPCAGAAPTIQQRRAQVVARFAGRGGQSVPYFVAYAANLGYSITITEFAPFRFGMRFGLPMAGEEWSHVWRVNAPLDTIISFRFGQGRFGERFRTWGNEVLECQLEEIKPAHTILLFSYS